MLIAPDGAIGYAEVRLGDSVIMVSDAQGEEYKPMQSGIHMYVEDYVLTRFSFVPLHSLKLAA
jgi:uncharacterized glyoxalase superfamily protein PhnB